jgi:electron transfer flavoprotein beta subunit
MLNIVVLIKQVPDTTKVRIDPETGNLDRKGVPSIINPFDIEGIFAALDLAKRYGARTTALSMGPPQAKTAIRQAIGLGIDEGILLSDRRFAGADTWATSYTLARAVMQIAKKSPVDIVIAGKQTIDGDTAQTGPGVARKMGIEQLTYVDEIIEIDETARSITVRRKLNIGRETVKTRLPALIAVLPGTASPVYASLPNMIRRARFKPVIWTADDIEVDPDLIGLKGSPTQVVKVFAPPEREPGRIINYGAETGRAVEELVRMISEDEYFTGGNA